MGLQAQVARGFVSILLTALSASSWILPQNEFQPARFKSGTGLSVAAVGINDAPSDSQPRFIGESPLSLSLDEFSSILDGQGRALTCWDCYRMGVDPVWLYQHGDDDEIEPHTDLLVASNPNGGGWTRDLIRRKMAVATTNRRQGQILGRVAQDRLKLYFGSRGKSSLPASANSFSIETHVAQLSKVTVSSDGTTKLLLKLHDGLEVETVIIPFQDRQTSTLCVSSQIGCAQACQFCLTGRMGEIRSLSADEILAQVYFALKACRVMTTPSEESPPSTSTGTSMSMKPSLHPIDNIVFMGMGEPAANADSVIRASNMMIGKLAGFQFAPRRVAISTVAPTPESFVTLASQTSVVLAWSVHSSKDSVRRRLVPTTRHSMKEFLDGLIYALNQRPSRKLRQIMLEVTLLKDINDSVDDAHHLAQTICIPLLENVEGIRLVVNLIPWNDIGATFGPASQFQRSPMSRVLDFQSVLASEEYPGILAYIRTTRGDDEHAACGMLATKAKGKSEMK